MFGKTNPYALSLLFSLLFILIFSQMSLKILKKFGILFYLFVGPSHFFVVVVDFIIYLVCRFSLWNVNLICNTCLSFLFFFLKEKIIKIVFSIQILLIYLLALESGIPYFLGYVIFTNARVGNIHSQIFTSTRVRNIISR